MTTYAAWAALYEGDTDAAYMNVLIPRLMEELVAAGTKLPIIPEAPAIRLTRGEPDAVAQQACDNADAFYLVFVHADTGGRAQEQGIHPRSKAYCEAMQRKCEWEPKRCVVITPRHETEAWILADAVAVTETLGYRGAPATIGLPVGAGEAERLVDPKATLGQVVARIRGRRRGEDLDLVLPAIAQRQRLDELRRSKSFRDFEDRLREALDDLGCL